MSQTQKTGLITRVTNAALIGQQPTAADFIELAKMLDANSISTAKAITEFHGRISDLESQVETLNSQIEADKEKGVSVKVGTTDEQKPAANDENFNELQKLLDDVFPLSTLFNAIPFRGMPTLIRIS